MEGADIYQIAKNCRTSVEMIEKFYAAHIKNTLDAAAINVRNPRTARRTGKAAAVGGGRPALTERFRLKVGECPPSLPETFSGSPSAPLAGSARSGSPQIPVPKGTLKS